MLIVLDNFLDTDSDLYRELSQDSLWKTPPRNSWIDRDQSPTNVWESLVEKIWTHSSSLLPGQFDGMEYWGDQLSPDHRRDIPWHQDKDEFKYYFAKITGTVTPYIGSLYYAHHEVPKGGFLQIRRGDDEEDIHNFERIQPFPNRLVLFDSASWHCVTPVTEGTRRHLASNIWIKKPMEQNFNPEGFDLSDY